MVTISFMPLAKYVAFLSFRHKKMGMMFPRPLCLGRLWLVLASESRAKVMHVTSGLNIAGWHETFQRLCYCCHGRWKDWVSSAQSLSRVQLFATPWTAAQQAFLSITNSWSLLRLISIESVMPSNHLILCRPLLLPPSLSPSNKVFSNESAFHIKWPKY